MRVPRPSRNTRTASNTDTAPEMSRNTVRSRKSLGIGYKAMPKVEEATITATSSATANPPTVQPTIRRYEEGEVVLFDWELVAAMLLMRNA